MAAELDHVILLLPYELIVKPPSWLTDLFVISPGGTHADGKTENRLVLFKDGTYLELIAFINDDPEKRRGHWWDKPYGVVDFAFTTKDEKFGTLSAIKERLSETATGISYADPQTGGRLRPDGLELRWRVTFPTGFTPENTTHACGAVGMGGVQLRVQEDDVSGLSKAMAAIVGTNLSKDSRYELSVPHDTSSSKPSIRIEAVSPGGKNGQNLALVIQTPLDLPALHHHIEQDVVSVLFEQV